MMNESVNEELKNEIERIFRDNQRQEQNEAIKKSKYAKNLIMIIGSRREVYEKEEIKKTKNKIREPSKIQAKMRSNKYWITEKRKKCRLCGEKEEDIEHILEECKEVGKKVKSGQSKYRNVKRI